MQSNPGVHAVMRLAQLGYRFAVDGETFKAIYEGQGNPDPSQVRPLFDLVKMHKNEVLLFLKFYCPKCGGVCFGTFTDGEERCLACYWADLKVLNPGMELTH